MIDGRWVVIFADESPPSVNDRAEAIDEERSVSDRTDAFERVRMWFEGRFVAVSVASSKLSCNNS